MLRVWFGIKTLKCTEILLGLLFTAWLFMFEWMSETDAFSVPKSRKKSLHGEAPGESVSFNVSEDDPGSRYRCGAEAVQGTGAFRGFLERWGSSPPSAAALLQGGNSRLNKNRSSSQRRFHNLTRNRSKSPQQLYVLIWNRSSNHGNHLWKWWVIKAVWRRRMPPTEHDENSIWLGGILASWVLALKHLGATAAVRAHALRRSQVIAVRNRS